MKRRRTPIHAFLTGPRRTLGSLLLAGALLVLVPLAGRAQAGVGDYPSPLYLAGPASAVTGHGSSYQLVGSLPAAPSTSVAAGASTLAAATYRYVYTVDTGAGETASAGATATVTTVNAEQVTVSGLPTGAGLTVRLYRQNLSTPALCYARLWTSLPNNAVASFTDTSGAGPCPALRRSEDRFPLNTTGWTELSPGTVAPAFGSPVSAGLPAAPNRKGWIVDGPGQVSFPTGPWTFEVQTRSSAPDGAALLVAAMWKVDAATGNPVGPAVLPATEQVQAPASLITGAVALQTVNLQVDVPAFALEANERLYVQFWRHQTAPYVTAGAANRILTMFAWDGVARITHPAGSGYAVEPTPVAPAAGVSTASLDLSAVFNDPDASDSGTVEFRVCTSPAGAGSACAAPVDTGSSASVATGATATRTIGAALTPGDTYHWQVRGRDALGGTSAWTATQSFTIDVAPSTPVLLAPGAGTAGLALAAQASYSDPDGDAGTVEVRVCSAEAAAGVECSGLVSSGSSASVASGTNASWTPGPPLGAGTYQWQARARDSLGAASAWTATRSFRVSAAPGAPALLWPDSGAVARSLALEASYADADGDEGSLELRVCSAEAAAGAECSGIVATASFAGMASGASARWIGEQLPDGVYHWQARATDALGAVSAWSATRMIRIDATPPGVPTALGGTVAGDGLTLRWLPPAGDDAIGNYVVYVDGRQSQVLGGQTFEAKLGPFDAADSRRFAVRAIDLAGNHGPLTGTIVGVPDLVGMTREEARSALAARGLVLRDETARKARAVRHDEVVVSQAPGVPSLLGTGSPIGVVLAAPARPLLRFTEVAVLCSPKARLVARIFLRETARVSVVLLDRRGVRVASWRPGLVTAGSRRLALRLPSGLSRPGRYRLSIAAATAEVTQRLSRPLTLASATRGATTAGPPSFRCARS